MKVSGPAGRTRGGALPPGSTPTTPAGSDVRAGNDNGMVPGEMPGQGYLDSPHETPLSPERRCLSVGGPEGHHSGSETVFSLPPSPPTDECRHCHVSVIDMVDVNGDPYLLVAHNPFCPMVSPDRSGGASETVEETAGESVWDEPWLSAPRWREERETT